jgi:hypothetical protein
VCGTSLRGEAMACGTPLCCSPVDLDALPISARARRGLLDLGESSAWSLDLGLYMDMGGVRAVVTRMGGGARASL